MFSRQTVLVFVSFVVLRSLLDYVVCMFFLDVVGPYWSFYAVFLSWSGLLIPLFLWDFKPVMVLLGGLGVCFAENFFYIWVNIFGNLNGCYDWYTGFFWNPDGVWGYSWTNPLGMLGYYQLIMGWFALSALVFAGVLHIRNFIVLEKRR